MTKPVERIKAVKKYPTHLVEFILVRGLFFITKLFPFAISSWLGRKFGTLAFQIRKSRRTLTIENIREAQKRGFLPNDIDGSRIARKAWENLGLLGIEFAYFSHYRKAISQAVTFEGADNLKRVLEKKKGVIMVTTHTSNWELMGMALAQAGFGINSIAKNQTNLMLNRYINKCRRSTGINPIPKKSFLRPVVEAFKRNEIVAFFIDQAAGRVGIPLKLFGRGVMIPRGAAEFALKLDKPVIFSYIVRVTPRKYRLVISEEIELVRSGDYQKDLWENSARFIGLVQSVVSRYPEQWLWMHRLWETDIKV